MAHTHDVFDMENHFEINGSSRFIKETSETKLVVVQGDHKSEVLTFKMPRYIDGHDMTLCNKIRIHYINLDTKTNNKSADVYEVTDLALCEECEDEILIFTWEIEAPATKYSGSLAFLVKFECTEGDSILYQWNTARYVGVNVLDGMDNSEEFVEKYSNVLEEWYNELTRGADSIEELNQQALAEIELAKEDAKEDIQGKADETMAQMTHFSEETYTSFTEDVEEKARQTLETIPEDYTEIDAEVKQLSKSVDEVRDELGILIISEDGEVIDYSQDKKTGYYTMGKNSATGDVITSFNSNDYGMDSVDFNVVAGEKYDLVATIYSAVCLYAFFDSYGNTVDCFPREEQDSTNRRYEMTVEVPENAVKMGFSFKRAFENSVTKHGVNSNEPTLKEKVSEIEKQVVELEEQVNGIEERVKTLETTPETPETPETPDTPEIPDTTTDCNKNLIHFLTNVLFVGDSLTAGSYYTGSGYVNSERGYPYFFSRMAQTNATIKAVGGYTPKNWYEEFATDVNYTDFDTAIIWLGTNEGLTDTIEEDTATETYADTNTGYYCRILEKMIAENPNIRIFLGTVHDVSGRYDAEKLATTNIVINKLAEKYASNVIGAVDNNDGTLRRNEKQKLYHPFITASGDDTIHYGTVGNLHLAEHWIDGICTLIEADESKFELL